MSKICRYIDWYITESIYKLDCHFKLVDDVICECSFIDLDNWEDVDIRILWLTPFKILNSPYFDIYYDDKVIE